MNILIWVITIAVTVSITAAVCAVLYSGAQRADLGRRRAALLTGGAAIVLGAWFAASALIADHGWYHTHLGRQVPWMPIAIAGFLGTLLLLSRLPLVASALAAPGSQQRLLLPHSFRVEGVVFLLAVASGRLPALLGLPAGLGDITTGIAALFVTRLLMRRTSANTNRALVWFNAFGLTDLVTALTIGALTLFGLVAVTPSAAPISELPLVLIPTVAVPMLFTLHITSLLALARTRRTATSGISYSVQEA
jgi:hypothetical protein